MDYYNSKGGVRYQRYLKSIIRKEGGVNFTPELEETFPELILGKKEEKLRKVLAYFCVVTCFSINYGAAENWRYLR